MTPDAVTSLAVWVVTDALPAAAEEYTWNHHLRASADLWVATGVMEDSERSNYFTSRWTFAYCNDVMVDRASRITVTTPPFGDRSFLPPREVAGDNWGRSRRFLRWAEWVRPWMTPQEQSRLDAVTDDVEFRQRVWSLIYDIQSGYLAEGARLSLGRLRDLVGVEVYNARNWPSPLPEFVDPDEATDPPCMEVLDP